MLASLSNLLPAGQDATASFAQVGYGTRIGVQSGDEAEEDDCAEEDNEEEDNELVAAALFVQAIEWGLVYKWSFPEYVILYVFRSPGGAVTIKNEDLVQQVHTEIMPGPHWYLWVVAVDPEGQGQGIGTILLKPGLESADADQLPCFVETHAEQNLPFYQKQGFELVRCEQVPGFDLHFWCFVREPR